MFLLKTKKKILGTMYGEFQVKQGIHGFLICEGDHFLIF